MRPTKLNSYKHGLAPTWVFNRLPDRKSAHPGEAFLLFSQLVLAASPKPTSSVRKLTKTNNGETLCSI